MRTSNLLRRSAIAALAVPALAMAAPAQAAVPGAMRALTTAHATPASLAHRASTGYFSVCLANSSNELCWHMNGAGTQPTLASNSSNYSPMTEVHVRRDMNGNVEWQFESGAGKCVYANVDNRVLEATGACDSGRTNEYWTQGLHSTNIESEAFPGQDIYVYNDLSGKPLYQDIFFAGTWRAWVTR
jgi:hypothetical protein